NTTGTITSFSTTPDSVFNIGGDAYRVETAGNSYSLTNPDSQTLRFEVHPGDKAWYDYADGEACDRAEIDGSAGARIPVGTPINLGFQFMVEPNGPNGSFVNTASSYFLIGEMHNDDKVSGVGTSPPFYINFSGGHMQIVALYCPP